MGRAIKFRPSLAGQDSSAYNQNMLNGIRLTMELTIPINTTATVYVPARDAAGVTESGQPVRWLRV